jgi:hypothetical protein
MSRTKIVMAALASLVAGAIIVVYAQWGDSQSPALAQTSNQEIAQGAEVEKPKAPTGSEAPKETQPESAAPPGSPEVIYDFNRLPDPITGTLQSIVVAAQSGNIDDMLPVLEENELPPMLSDKAVGDPIAFWKKQSADGKGQDILAAMLNVFSSGFLRKGEGKQAMYIWPYFAEMDLTKLTPAQDVDLYRIVPPPLGIEMKRSGKYTYYRAGIGADGVWHYFLK